MPGYLDPTARVGISKFASTTTIQLWNHQTNFAEATCNQSKARNEAQENSPNPDVIRPGCEDGVWRGAGLAVPVSHRPEWIPRRHP
jgi:hypothetical protein